MLREMFQAKLHHGAVTECRFGYQGSLTVDIDLIERAGMLVNQKVQVLNLNNGYRLETYLIAGERGKRDLIINALPGDRLIVIAYALMDDREVVTHKPTVLVLNERNEVIETQSH